MRAVSPTRGGSLVGSRGEKVEALLLNEPGISPLLEQVRNFPTWGEFVADAVGVDLFDLRRVLCGEHYIAWVNDLPDMPLCP